MDAGLIQGIVWAAIAWVACGIIAIMLAHDRGHPWLRALVWGLAAGPLGIWRVAGWPRKPTVLLQRLDEERASVYAERERSRKERAKRRRADH